MAIYAEIGYLEADYLIDPYFEGTAFDGLFCQVDRRINGTAKTTKAQAEARIDLAPGTLSQASRELTKEKPLLSQVERALLGEQKDLPSQVDRKVTPLPRTLLFEASRGGLKQGDCSHTGYLTAGYLSEPYLTPFVCVPLPMQANRQARVDQGTLSQALRHITKTKVLKSQAERRIDDDKSVLMQVEAKKAKTINMQVRKVLYNTFNIRVLWDFASRGTGGNNWTVTGGTVAPGDFGVSNLNTDIVEQCFRGIGTVNLTLVCDTGIPAYVDTIGILGHNLRTSGLIQVEGASTSSFTDSETFNLYPDGTSNIIWVAPSIPLKAYRFWRFAISDSGNPAGYLQIGSIVFGSASIFQGENVVDTIVKTQKHFADKVATEGFTAVSNDRALKSAVSLEFRSLSYDRENYAMLKQIFEYCRTSLKALWIPTPRSPTRFGVFGKLSSLPSEQHQSFGEGADYVSFTVEVDESL